MVSQRLLIATGLKFRVSLGNYDELVMCVSTLMAVLSAIHELSLDGRTFWAWCAFDVLGIFGALHASGSIQSHEPCSNKILRQEFIGGVPQSGILWFSWLISHAMVRRAM